jgi:arylsulfatase A-like enzyme
VVGARVESVDIAATLPGLVGLEPMRSVDGKDLTGLLRDDDAEIRDLAVTENALSKAMHWEDWWFVHYPRRLFAGQDVGELYDLSTDPDETTNLYTDPAKADVVVEARLRLLDWLSETTRVTSAIAAEIADTALAGDLLGGPDYLRPYH